MNPAAFNVTSGTAGSFDLYLLAQSWQPQFCYHKNDQYPGCNSPQDEWKTQFTLHGLWPEYETGYPQNCGTEAFDASAVTAAIGIDVMNRYWPNVKTTEDDSAHTQFWEHEWTKHGTCSGLGQVDYFTQAINLLKNGQSTTPDVISQNVGGSASADDIRSGYGGANYVGLHCKGKYLSEAYTCWALLKLPGGGDHHSDILNPAESLRDSRRQDGKRNPTTRLAHGCRTPTNVVSRWNCARPRIGNAPETAFRRDDSEDERHPRPRQAELFGYNRGS